MAPLEIRVGERYETLWEETRASGYVRIRVDGQDLLGRRAAARSTGGGKHDVEVVIDRVTVRSDARSRIAGTVENALALGRGVLRVAHPRDDVPEIAMEGRNAQPALRLRPLRAEFRAAFAAQLLVQQRLGMVSGLRRAWARRPARIPPRCCAIRSSRSPRAPWGSGRTPAARCSRKCSMRFRAARAFPIDVPFEELSGRHRRLIFHGTGEQWFDATVAGDSRERGLALRARTSPTFRFQYKGLYPALEEASRVSPAFRAKLEHLVDEVECSVCGGSRLRDDAAAVQLRDRTIDDLCRMPLGQAAGGIPRVGSSPTPSGRWPARWAARFTTGCNSWSTSGLEYLTLARPAPSLSGGEMQRIRLAAQLGSGLCGVLYVLDEPTIGLHPRDNRRLLGALQKLRDLGNTLLVVEHDREVIGSADQLLDFGPAAGQSGGQIVAQGTPEQVARRRGSVTGPYLSGKKAIPVPTNRRIAGREGQRERGEGRQEREDEREGKSGTKNQQLRQSRQHLPLSPLPSPLSSSPTAASKSSAHGTTT